MHKFNNLINLYNHTQSQSIFSWQRILLKLRISTRKSAWFKEETLRWTWFCILHSCAMLRHCALRSSNSRKISAKQNCFVRKVTHTQCFLAPFHRITSGHLKILDFSMARLNYQRVLHNYYHRIITIVI